MNPPATRLKVRGLAVLVGTALFLVTFLRSVPCARTALDRPLLGCSAGIQAYTGDPFAHSPLLTLVVMLTTRAATLIGTDVDTGVFALATLGLLVCFLALIMATGFLGRHARGWSSRNALLIASSPIVLAVGLIGWELLPLALTAVGLGLMRSGRSVPAALVLAIASCTGTMPIGVSVAALVALGLHEGRYPAARFGATWVASCLAVHLPLALTDPGRLWGYYRGQAGAEPGFGSLWHLAQLAGFDQPHAGSIGFAGLAIGLGCLFGFLRATGRRPEVGSLVAVVVLSTIVLGPGFPPQNGLWVLFVVVLARPFPAELIAVTVTQVAHALAAWDWFGEAGWVAVVLRCGVEIWILSRVLLEVLRTAPERVAAVVPIEPRGLRARWRRPLIAAAIATVVTRAVFLLGAYVMQWLMTTDQVKPEFKWDIWLQWDAHHYLAIAEHGYGPDVVGGNAPAFFPLFPLTIRALTSIGLEPVHAGLLISALATFVASAYLYRLAELHGFDGDRSIVYLLLFPTGVFLVAPYTEALFLVGAIPAFYYALRGRPWPAAAFTAIAVGTRTVGLFVLLGVAIELAIRAWPSWRKMASAVAAMVVASLPFWAYGLYLAQVRGSFWTFMDVQRTGWGRDFMGFTDGFLATWNTWQGGYSANQIFTWRLEIVFAALSLVLLVWVMWRGYLGYAVYVGATLVIGLSNAWYYSTPRLALAFFPFAFLVAALVGKRERAHTYTVLAMAVLATVGLVAYTRGAWFF